VLGVIADVLAARLRGAMQTREFDDAAILQPLIIEVHTESSDYLDLALTALI